VAKIYMFMIDIFVKKYIFFANIYMKIDLCHAIF